MSARTSRAPARRRTRAHASSVAPVVVTSSTSTTLGPATLACMHGSSFSGDGARALREFGDVLERCFGPA